MENKTAETFTGEKNKNMKKQVQYSAEDLKIKAWLLELAEKQYSHADSFYAFKNANGNWEYGSSNDEPMKFGNGNNNQMKGNIAKILFATTQTDEILKAIEDVRGKIEKTQIIVSNENEYINGYAKGYSGALVDCMNLLDELLTKFKTD